MFLGWIDTKKTGFIKMVQDVVIAICVGASKQAFVYRRFLQLDQWRNIPLWWVGGSVRCSISHPHLLAFMATLLYNRENKAKNSHFLLNQYQICHQEKGDFSSLHPLSGALQCLETLKNWLKPCWGRE